MYQKLKRYVHRFIKHIVHPLFNVGVKMNAKATN